MIAMTEPRSLSGAAYFDTTKGLRRAGPMLENVTESAAACMLTMVQGNVLAFGLGHWIVASQTGILLTLMIVISATAQLKVVIIA